MSLKLIVSEVTVSSEVNERPGALRKAKDNTAELLCPHGYMLVAVTVDIVTTNHGTSSSTHLQPQLITD